MSEVQACVDRIRPPGPAVNWVLNSADVRSLKSALSHDVRGYAYSSSISFVDLLRGLGGGFRTWPVVKSYYSLFYALRSYCAANDYSVFYVGTKPFVVRAAVGEAAKKLSGRTTHKAVLALATRTLGPGNTSVHRLLSQEIDLEPPFDWMMKQREQANYKEAFVEPMDSKYLSSIVCNGVRRSLVSYVADVKKGDYMYTFDPDHALVAYPLAWIMELPGYATGLGGERTRFLCKNARDKQGEIAALTDVFASME